MWDTIKKLPITFWLVFITTIVTFVEFLFFSPYQFALKKGNFEIYQLFTYVFSHGSINHYISNIFALMIFGLILEKIVGKKRFSILILTSYIFVTFSSLYFYPSVIGISGIVYSIIAALGVLEPQLIVFVFGVPLPMFLAIIFWLLIDLLNILYPSDIASISHITGFIVGFIFGIKWRRKFRKTEKKEKEIDIDIEDWERKYMN